MFQLMLNWLKHNFSDIHSSLQRAFLMFSKALNKKFVYLTTVSITIGAIVVLYHTKNFYESSMCVITNTASMDKKVDTSLRENTGNFIDVAIEQSIH